MKIAAHLQPLSEIQAKLSQGNLQVSDLFESFRNSIQQGVRTNAWEAVSDDLPSDNLSSGSLYGLLIGVKDNIATKEFPTTMGSPHWSGTKGGFDARVVSKLRSSGALIVGKTKCSAFAVHDTTNTLNPRYPDCEPGTSSSGSAAAVSGLQVSVALGTQTAGSIAKPASYCGVIGYKPTFGEIPRTGVLKTTEMFDSVGFFGRRISDIQLVYFASRVTGPNHPIHERARHDSKQLSFRTGFILCGNDIDETSPILHSSFLRILNEFSDEFGIKLNLMPSFDFKALRESLFMVYYKDLSYYLLDQKLDNRVSENLQNIIEFGRKLNMQEYDHAKKVIVEWRKFVKKYLGNSLIFSVSTSSAAPRIGESDSIDANFFITSAGLPQMSLPILRDTDGRIVNLSISSPSFSDEFLLNLGLKIFPGDAMSLPSYALH